MFLQNSKMKNSDRTIRQLRTLLQTSVIRLENLFKKLLMECSNEFDPLVLLSQPSTTNAPSPTKTSDERLNSSSGDKLDSPQGKAPSVDQFAQLFSIPVKTLRNLMNLAQYLASLEADPELQALVHANFLKAVTDIRSAHLLRMFQNLVASTKSSLSDKRTVAGSDSMLVSGVYVKGSSPLLQYTRAFFAVIYYEWIFLQHILPSVGKTIKGKNDNGSAMEAVLGPCLNQYRECVDIILNRVRKNAVQNHDFSIIFMLLDALETLLRQLMPPSATANVLDWQEAMKHAGKRSNDLNQIIQDTASAALRSFGEFVDDIRNSAAKTSQLSEDGTVNQLSSNTLTYLKRLCDYSATVETLLHVCFVWCVFLYLTT